ncbi:MAG: hypothetical protein ABJ382_23165 [Ilumatobacter sp.]
MNRHHEPHATPRFRPIWRSATGRARWAAIGAALAVTVGAGGGFGLAQAAITTGERPVYIPITPCRLADTRASAPVGARATPIGEGETHVFSTHGANGNCNIPTDALALTTNVTAIGATSGTFLTFWPSDVARPDASSLNPGPGQRPTPNAVTTPVSPVGQFSIYNDRGSVDVIVDLVGYYADHGHDEYADVDHTHDEYADVDHTHAEYAPVGHTHDDKAGRTGQISLGPDEFRPQVQDQEWAMAVGQIYIPTAPSSTGADHLYAPIVLPTGALITGATARIVDNQFLDPRVELERKGNAIAAGDLFEVDTSGAVDAIRDFPLIEQGSTPKVIDNSNSVYYVEISLKPGSTFTWSTAGSTLRVASVVIDYELPA